MEFLKKHFEKILLSVVLLALAVAAAALPLKVSSVYQTLQDIKTRLIKKGAKQMPPLDLSTNETLLARLDRPPPLKLSVEHNLFSPVKWERRPDGTLRKLLPHEHGPSAVRISNIVSLTLTINYQGLVGASAPARDRFSVEKQAAARATDRSPKTAFAQVGQKNDTFMLKDITGPPESPTELVLELSDDKTVASVSTNKPFKRVAGYMADLLYPPENKFFNNKRVGDKVNLSKVDYKIVSITDSEVILEDPTTKRTPIRRR